MLTTCATNALLLASVLFLLPACSAEQSGTTDAALEDTVTEDTASGDAVTEDGAGTDSAVDDDTPGSDDATDDAPEDTLDDVAADGTDEDAEAGDSGDGGTSDATDDDATEDIGAGDSSDAEPETGDAAPDTSDADDDGTDAADAVADAADVETDASDDGDASTAVTCEELEGEYLGLIADAQACNEAGSCHVLFGHCGVGLGGCHYGTSPELAQATLDAISGRWVEAGCMEGRPVCRCTAPPEAHCQDGVCALR